MTARAPGRLVADEGHAARVSREKRRIDIGDVVASAKPRLLHTLLGSCVSVCLFDPNRCIGGMNHILVPSSNSNKGCSTRFGVQAMELLINELMMLGADRRVLVAKAFGGGNVLAAFRKPTVGELNREFVRQFLHTEKIPLLAERLGGDLAVRVKFQTDTGMAFVQSVDGVRLPSLIREETLYYNTRLVDRFRQVEPTIF